MYKKIVYITLMILGEVLILISAAMIIVNAVQEKEAASAANTALQVLRQDIERAGTSPLRDTAVDIDGKKYIGYLEIPALEISLPVLNEWSYDNLKMAPCRYYGSVAENDVVIAAHNYKKYFGAIHQLSLGDTVWFTDVNEGVFCYSVEKIEILESSGVKKMIESDYDLTLFTCTYGGQQRIAIRCNRCEIYR